MGRLTALPTRGVCLAAGLYAAATLAADYHVSADGSDRTGKGTVEQPWRTLQRAADKIRAGDTVFVQDGAYAPFRVDTPGKPDRRITFKAVSGDARIEGFALFDGRAVSVSILASYITVEGFHILVNPVRASSRSRGIRVSGINGRHVQGVHIRRNRVENAGWVGITTSYADDVLIEDNRVSGSYREHGIYVANSGDRPIVRGNIAHDNNEAGIQLNADPHEPGDGIITGARIENNILYRNGRGGSSALNLASVRNSRVVNNLLYANVAQGIAAWDDEAGVKYGSKNNQFLHNTVVMPAGSRHAMALRHGSTGNVIKNNVLLHAGSADSLAVDASSADALVSDYNVLTRLEDTDGQLVALSQWQARRKLDLNSREAQTTAVFVDPAADNYQIRTGSPAQDTGDLSVGVTYDIRNVPRPQGNGPDIGAYELGATGAVAR